MIRPLGIILLALLVLFMSDDPGRKLQAQPNLCEIALTRVVRIPVTTFGGQDSKESAATLSVSRGAADEPPEGPDGFDVFDDGSLLVTEPLRKRISHFDASGKLLKQWQVGFAADSVTVLQNDVVLVREASTGQLHAFDREGLERSAEGVKPLEPFEARVQGGKNIGTVDRPAHGLLAIQLEKPGVSLLSLEGLATDEKGDTYVALETTTNSTTSDAVNLNKYVRRYSFAGKLLCEVAGIPLDYYVPPVDELRVHKSIVYQLQTTSSEVRINVWDTSQLCSRQH